MQNVHQLHDEIAACQICTTRFQATATQHAPRPVSWLSDRAPIIISGQAPGKRVHLSGLPFDDRSGDRLRDWLGVDRAAFYDKEKFAILPMGFCFPGYDAKGADLVPPVICAQTWRKAALSAMPQVKLHILVGAAAQNWHFEQASVTARVKAWRTHIPTVLPLPHPSWRNTGWLKKNQWFETDVIPWLRLRVADLLDGQT